MLRVLFQIHKENQQSHHFFCRKQQQNSAMADRRRTILQRSIQMIDRVATIIF